MRYIRSGIIRFLLAALRSIALHRKSKFYFAVTPKRSLPALLTGGICRGDQAQALPQLSWGIDTGEIAQFGHHGHGPGELHAAQGLKCVDDRMQAPRFDLVL